MMTKARVLAAAFAVIVLAVGQAHATDPVIHLPLDGDFTNQGTGGSLYDGFPIQGSTGSYTFTDDGDGRGTYLDIDNDGALKTDGVFVAVDYTLPETGSISLWYKPEAWYNYQTVYDNGTGSAEYWEMWIYNDGRLRTRPNNNHPDYGYEAAPVTYDLDALGGPGNWYHITYTWDKNDATNQATQMYLNGRLVDQNYCAWTDPGPAFYLAGGQGGNTYGTGAWDDLRIYDAVLPASEIEQLAGVGPLPSSDPLPSPVVHYDFEGDVVNNGTGGAAYDGTLNLGANGSSAYVTGTSGQGIEFDHPTPGDADGAYVTVPYELGEEGTISTTFKASAYFNYLSLWDNSIEGNDWEQWIYSDGDIRTRIEAGEGDIHNFGAPVDEWMHIVYAWSLPDGSAAMYVNGALVGIDDIEHQNWIEPGTEMYIAGGHQYNDAGIGIYDEFKIFDVALDHAQVQLLYDEEIGNVDPGDDLEGDLDGDGFVGSADLDIVRGNWGASVTAGDLAAGDPSGDGLVGSADLDIVRGNWGASAAASVVPEPSVFALLAVGLAFGLLRGRK